MARKRMGKRFGSGYKSLIRSDKKVHSNSAKGIKTYPSGVERQMQKFKKKSKD